MSAYSILVVDDEKNNQELILGMLQQVNQGYKILLANNGKTACQVATAKLPDLIIMDWEMPEMSGIEAVKILKQNLQTQDIPVIIASGIRMSPENLEIALMSGAIDFIRKPIEPVELIARVRSALSVSEYIKQIKNQNHELEASLQTIQRQREQLISSEKLALLGEVTSIIAHEMNTPLSAVQNGAITMNQILGEIFTELPVLIESFSDRADNALLVFINELQDNMINLSTKAERQLSANLQTQLENLNITNGELFAEKLAKLGFSGELSAFLPFFQELDQHPDGILTIYKMGVVWKQLHSIQSASGKAFEKISALKTYALSNDDPHKLAIINPTTNLQTVLGLYEFYLNQGMKIHTDFQVEANIMGNIGELNQLWTNLLMNAYHTSGGKGELHICISTQNQMVQVAFTLKSVQFSEELIQKLQSALLGKHAEGDKISFRLALSSIIAENHQGKLTYVPIHEAHTFTVSLPAMSN